MTASRRSRVALAAAIVAALLSGQSASSSAAPPESGTVDLICADIGRVRVALDGPRILDAGPLALVGPPGFTGRTAMGRTLDIAPPPGANCVSEHPATVDLRPLIALPDGGRASTGRAVGLLHWTVTITAEPAQTQVASTSGFPFAAALTKYLDSRPGDVTVAVQVRGLPTVFGYTKGATRNYTASIVKVGIMAAVMDRARRLKRQLTSWERSQLEPMIRMSDNTAATALWDDVGGGPKVGSVMTSMGATDVVIDPGGHWGLTQTSAADWVAVLGHFAAPSAYITDTNRAYADDLMSHVSSDQDWGVSAGPPGGTVRLKNGWLPRTTGWHVNSIGNSTASPTPYSIAVLSHNTGGTQATQQSTIEGVSRLVWDSRAQLAPAQALPRGEWSGDRAADLLGVTTNGTLSRYAGNGAGAFTSLTDLGGAWGGYSLIGSPGDFNLDGLGDLVAVRRSDGAFVAFRGRGRGTFSSGVVTASGFGGYVALTSAGRFDANSSSLDVLAKTPAGEVIQFALTSSGRPVQVRSLGTALARYQRLAAVADSDGDGWGEVWALTSTGSVRPFNGTASGFAALAAGRTGWGTYRLFASPGDLDGNGFDDLVAVDASGAIRRYLGGANGGMGVAGLVMSSAKSMTTIF